GRIHADDLVEAALHPQVLVGGEDASHVVADRHVARAQHGYEQSELKPARASGTHQNLSGRTRATNRYAVSRMPAMRPIQFSALKALPSLHQEIEQREHNDREADVQHVEHGSLLGGTTQYLDQLNRA